MAATVPIEPTGQRIQFLQLNLLIQLIALGGAAPWMVQVIRADGGAPPEYVVYLLYVLVLVLGVFLLGRAAGAVARRLGGPGTERGVVVLLQAAVSLALFADVGTFLIFGLHPYGEVTWAGIGTADIQNLPLWAFGLLLGIVLLAVIFQGGLWIVADRFSRRRSLLPLLGWRPVVYFALGMSSFLLLDRADAEALVPRAALPYYSLWAGQRRAFPDLRPAHPMPTGEVVPLPLPPTHVRPDLAVIMVESLRWDMLTPEHMPRLSAFLVQHGCTLAHRHYAGGHLTQYGTFSLLYGLDADYFIPFMQERRPSYPLARLRASGYQLEGFDATGVLSYLMPPLLPDQFDHYQTLLQQDTLVIDHVVEMVQQEGPQFAFGFLYSTHTPYLFPPEFATFASNAVDPRLDANTSLFNKYRNSVGYVDYLLAQLGEALVPQLEQGTLGLVIAGDHGEEFWEHGLFGHAATQFYDARVRVPVVFCLPGTPMPTATGLSRHADIFPTLFDWMAATWPEGVMSGRSLYAADQSPAGIVLAGAGYPNRAASLAVVTDDYTFWLESVDPTLREIRVTQIVDTLDRSTSLDATAQASLDRAMTLLRTSRHSFLRVN